MLFIVYFLYVCIFFSFDATIMVNKDVYIYNTDNDNTLISCCCTIIVSSRAVNGHSL